MKAQTPETRPPAPGSLRIVQEFMNSGHLGPANVHPAVAAEVRARLNAGESHGSVAAGFGLSQPLVAAIARGARVEDDLASPESAAAWLLAHDLLPSAATLSRGDVEALRECREALRRLAEANNGAPLDANATRTLDRIASRAPLLLRFDAWPEPRLAPPGAGIEHALGGLLAIVHASQRDGTFQRLKRCPGDGCPHTFYDASRNRTGTWCAMSVCGNRSKVRSYQQRRKARPATRR